MVYRKRKNTWVWLLLAIIVVALIANNNYNISDRSININELQPTTSQESFSGAKLSRQYSIGGAICSLEADQTFNFTATSSSDQRACYTNNAYEGIAYQLTDVTNGWDTLGEKQLLRGDSECFPVTQGHRYVASIYYCNTPADKIVCRDTDDRNYELKGSLTVAGLGLDEKVYYDECVDQHTLLERYCDPDQGNLNEQINCDDVTGPNSVCVDGRCFSQHDSMSTISCATCDGDQRVVRDLTINIAEGTACYDYPGYFPTEASFKCENSIVSTETGPGTYFAPVVTNMWVETYPGSNDWVLVPKGSSIPQEITQQWHSGEYVDVVVELNNSGAKDYTTQDNRNFWTKAANVGYESLTPERQLLMDSVPSFTEQMVNWNRISYVPGVGYVWDLEAESDKTMVNDENIELINQIPFINFGFVEVSFLNPNNEGVYGFPRFSTLESIRPVSKRNACLGSEQTEGWIDSYAVLMTPPIDGTCWNFNNLPNEQLDLYGFGATTARYTPKDYNGFCDLKIKARVKVPEVGDHIASGLDNYNAEGKYYLQSSVYEKCSHPVFGSPDWLKNYETKAYTVPGAVGEVCCRTGALWWTKYYYTTDANCEQEGGVTKTDADSVDKCHASSMAKKEYYKCDAMRGKVFFNNYSSTDYFDKQLWKLLPTGGEEEAYRICGLTKPAITKDCYSCSNERITVPENESCPKMPLATTDYWDSSELAANCGEGSFITCYSCSEGSFVETQAKFTNSEETSCHSAHAYTSSEKNADPQACLKLLAANDSAKIYSSVSDSDDTQWCVAYGGLVTCYPRKKPTSLSSISSSVESTRGFLQENGEDFVKTLVKDGDSSLCLPAFSSDMCSAGSTCLVAEKGSVQRDRATVYDALADLLSWQNVADYLTNGLSPEDSWLNQYFYKDKGLRLLSSKESFVETMGVCVPEKRSFLTNIRYWFAELLGLEPSSNGVTVAIIISSLAGLWIIYEFVKPPKPRRPIGYQQPLIQKSLVKRKPVFRFKKKKPVKRRSKK